MKHLRETFLYFYFRFRHFIIKIQGQYVEVEPHPKFDAPIINDRINYVANHGGGTVFLKAGVYEINNPIELKSNVALIGES